MSDYRLDIATLLRQGQSDRAIMRELHCGAATVARTREAIGLPNGKRGRRPATLEELFRARTEIVDGGHLRWTGYVEDGVPRLRVGGRGGHRISAHRLAFRLHTGRDADGPVTPTCAFPGCVAPDHVAESARETVDEEYQERERRLVADLADAKRHLADAKARHDQLRRELRELRGSRG